MARDESMLVISFHTGGEVVQEIRVVLPSRIPGDWHPPAQCYVQIGAPPQVVAATDENGSHVGERRQYAVSGGGSHAEPDLYDHVGATVLRLVFSEFVRLAGREFATGQLVEELRGFVRPGMSVGGRPLRALPKDAHSFTNALAGYRKQPKGPVLPLDVETAKKPNIYKFGSMEDLAANIESWKASLRQGGAPGEREGAQ